MRSHPIAVTLVASSLVGGCAARVVPTPADPPLGRAIRAVQVGSRQWMTANLKRPDRRIVVLRG
jgi:hypothetical protein